MAIIDDTSMTMAIPCVDGLSAIWHITSNQRKTHCSDMDHSSLVDCVLSLGLPSQTVH